MIRVGLSRLRSGFATVVRSTSGKVGVGLTIAFLLVTIMGPFFAPYSPTAFSGRPLATPSWKHLLGTDDVGEDLFSQLIYSTGGSVEIGLLAGLITTVVGTAIGLLAGYYRGLLDEILMRVADAVLVIPTLVLLLTVAAYTKPSTYTVIILIGALSWPFAARVIRSETLSLRSRPFIDSSRMSGMRDIEVISRVIVPIELPLIILYGVLASVSAVVVETGFDLIGVGSFDHLSLGIMLYFAFKNSALLSGAWWWFLPPGLVIGFFGTGLLFFGRNIERLRRRL